MKIKEHYKDFLVTKSLPITELKSHLLELTHEPTGAKVLHIANDDPENLFCLSFQTFPSSSNGVAHILEHTVLCGSKKFPIKDPFFSMMRRSLNTFMNAMTGADFTCYPASSQVEKDFYNLLEVYLDAAFYPELKKLSFLQEGHRLEFTELEDPSSPLLYKGVVFNEMKGVYASSDSRLWHAIMENLLPDLPYTYSSGGDPKVIPELTHKQLIEFHKHFYHPSRCIFFFYGNLPLEKHLDFIEKNVLKQTKKIPPLPPIPLQKRFSSPKSIEESYPISQDEPLEEKTFLSFSWLTAKVSDQLDILALTLLDIILMGTDASPLKEALLKSGLCKEADSSIDLEMSEVPFTIVCKGCEKENAAPLHQLIHTTLENIHFSKEMVEAALHQLEFSRTEISGGYPFGLTLFFRSALAKQHGCEPENSLVIHALFSELRSHLKDPSYLKNLINRFFLTNPHFLTLTLSPNPNLEKEEQAEERKKLDTIQSNLLEEEKRKIVKEGKELKAFQEKAEHQAIDCLPKIALKDVPETVRDYPLHQEKLKSWDIFHHDCFTNQILYVDLFFSLPHIEKEDLPYLSFFSYFLTEMGCGGKTNKQTLQYLQAYTGDVHASISLNVDIGSPDTCTPRFSIGGKALYRNSAKLFTILKDFAMSAQFDDPERIKELLLQHTTLLEQGLTKNAMRYASLLASSGFSLSSFLSETLNGLTHYQVAKELVENIDTNLLAFIEKMKKLQKQILSFQEPHLVLSCDHAHYEELKKQKFFSLTDLLSTPIKPWEGNYDFSLPSSQGRIISSPVAFTTQAFKLAPYTDPDAPALLVATELFLNQVLHPNIREKGGAYGSGARYSPTVAQGHFYAFRDPHLSNTLKTFTLAIEHIGEGKFTEQNLEEAKLGILQDLDAPISPGNRALSAYGWLLSGKTKKRREAFRKKILHLEKREVEKAIATHFFPQKEKGITISFAGKSLLEKDSLPNFPIHAIDKKSL